MFISKQLQYLPDYVVTSRGRHVYFVIYTQLA
jgi:hypothetical protein